jgi:hypothetical protein
MWCRSTLLCQHVIRPSGTFWLHGKCLIAGLQAKAVWHSTCSAFFWSFDSSTVESLSCRLLYCTSNTHTFLLSLGALAVSSRAKEATTKRCCHSNALLMCALVVLCGLLAQV